MLTLDFFIDSINVKIKDNDFNILTFNFGQIINDNLFFHDINNLELYIEKIKQKEYNFNYKSYQKLTDGINNYIIYSDKLVKKEIISQEKEEIKMIETRGFQDVLHFKSYKDIKVNFKNIFENIINQEEIPKDLDKIEEEVIEFIINQDIKLMIINQKYPKISKIKNDLIINLSILENQDQNKSNLVEVYNLFSFIFQE